MQRIRGSTRMRYINLLLLTYLLTYLNHNHSILIFTKFGGKVTHGPRKNLLDVGGNPDRFGLGIGLRLRFHVTPGRNMLRLGEGRPSHTRNTGCILPAACDGP